MGGVNHLRHNRLQNPLAGRFSENAEQVRRHQECSKLHSQMEAKVIRLTSVHFWRITVGGIWRLTEDELSIRLSLARS